MGTKSRTVSSPNPNIRIRPNGIGRSPKMGRVQQIQPYQLGELVETPLGLRRITGVAPFTINVDLGPRSRLVASVAAGATTFTVKGITPDVELSANDVLIVGDAVSSYRETVKVASAVTITTSNTTISISSGFKNDHKRDTLVVVQKLPPDFSGAFVELEELKILGEDSYAYVIPSVPKSPRYISRTGETGNDDVKNESLPTEFDPTQNFTRYEAPRKEDIMPLLNASAFPATPDSVYLSYQLYLVGRNSDNTARPRVDREGLPIPGDPSVGDPIIEGKEPMVLTVDILESGAEKNAALTAAFGSTVSNMIVCKFNIPTAFDPTAIDRAVRFPGLLRERMFRNPGENVDFTTLLPISTDALGTSILLSHQTPDDLETDAQRVAQGLFGAFNCAANSQKRPPLRPFQYEVGDIYEVLGNQALYLFISASEDDVAIAEQMHLTVELSGTFSTTAGSTTVTGVGTSFTTELKALSTGKKECVIRFAGREQTHRIQSITNDTTLVLTSPVSNTQSGVKAFKASFSNVPIMKDQFLVMDPVEVLGSYIEFNGTSTSGKDNAGFISSRVFLELPRGQPRWSSNRALDSGKGDETGFVDAFQSPEDQPNESFGFYVGKNEESLPFMRALNSTGETILDGRAKLTGFIFTAPRVEAQELKKIRQRSGFYKAKVFPHTGFFPKLEDRPTGPPEGWEPRQRTIQRTLVKALKDLSLNVKKQMRD